MQQVEMSNFSNPQWSSGTRRVDCWISGDHARTHGADRRVDVRGEGQFASGKYKGEWELFRTEYRATVFVLSATGLTSRGSYKIDNRGWRCRFFLPAAFGGRVTGRVEDAFRRAANSERTLWQDVRLAAVLPAIEHRDFRSTNALGRASDRGNVEPGGAPSRTSKSPRRTVWRLQKSSRLPSTGEWCWKFRYRYDPNILAMIR